MLVKCLWFFCAWNAFAVVYNLFIAVLSIIDGEYSIPLLIINVIMMPVNAAVATACYFWAKELRQLLKDKEILHAARKTDGNP